MEVLPFQLKFPTGREFNITNNPIKIYHFSFSHHGDESFYNKLVEYTMKKVVGSATDPLLMIKLGQARHMFRMLIGDFNEYRRSSREQQNRSGDLNNYIAKVISQNNIDKLSE